jgi:hypothetical protein
VLRFMATAVTADPLLRNLHGDPRFQALLAKMKLDDWKRTILADVKSSFESRRFPQ